MISDKEFADLKARVDALETASGLFASDKDLDGPKGNISIKFDARDWRGPTCKGRRASECPPDFLDLYASALTYMADHPKPGKDPKFSGYDRLDAARCRSWARRMRSGWVAPKSDAPDFPGDRPSTQSFSAPGFSAPTFNVPDAEFEDPADDAGAFADEDIPF